MRVARLFDQYLAEGAPAGAIGTTVEVYDEAYEFEFPDKGGTRAALLVVNQPDIALVADSGATLVGTSAE